MSLLSIRVYPRNPRSKTTRSSGQTGLNVSESEPAFDDRERDWAAEQRQGWPAGRPLCVLSTGALTNRTNAERVDWSAVVRMLSRDFTVVQAVVSEPAATGAIVLQGLSIRQYMALIASADCFVGATTGGSHVAAAFDVPSVVVAWRSLLDHLQFPVSGLGFDATFLYPQQWFTAAEDLSSACFRETRLRDLLDDMARHGRKGRPTCIGNYPSRPCGFIPARPRRAVMVRNRFVLIPS